MASYAVLVVVLLLLSSSSVVSAAQQHLRVRGLDEGRKVFGVYQNPCTLSWSNDVGVLSITDCDAYNNADNDGAITGSSGLVGGNGGGNDIGNGSNDGAITGSSGGLVGGGNDIGNGSNDGSRGDNAGDSPSNDCSITTPDDPTAPTVFYPVEYWYCVETTENNTSSWLPTLEQKIYEIAVDQMTWCIGYPVRRLQQAAAVEQMTTSRQLGILSVTSQPTDNERPDVIYPGNNNGVDDDDQECHVIQGGMQIIARETDDLNNTIASILTKIEDAMTNDELLGDDIPTVTNVTYIGTSQEEVENNSTIILPPILPPLNSIPETDADDDDNGNMIIGLTASMAFLAFLFFLLWRKKRKVATTSRFLAVADDGFKPLHGTGDPPGSFHYGIYHYFPTGEHYLSTNCHDCHETRDSGDYGGGGPPAITAVLSDDDYYGRLIAANSKDIGRGTSAMNVHRCTSSTCHLCLPSKNNVEIVKVKNPIVDTYDL